MTFTLFKELSNSFNVKFMFASLSRNFLKMFVADRLILCKFLDTYVNFYFGSLLPADVIVKVVLANRLLCRHVTTSLLSSIFIFDLPADI